MEMESPASSSGSASASAAAVGTLTEAQIDHLVEKIKHELSHPDIIDRAVAEYVFAEWIRKLADAGLAGSTLELPISLSSTTTKDTKNDDGSFQQCEHHFIGLFGHELVAWDSCQSGSGTGSGHSTGGVSTT